jgi:hypothetical protein
MPEKKTLERAAEDKAEGKSPSTQAGEFVREEIEQIVGYKNMTWKDCAMTNGIRRSLLSFKYVEQISRRSTAGG